MSKQPTCKFCRANPATNPTVMLTRINELGEKGEWCCHVCLPKTTHSYVQEIVGLRKMLAEANARNTELEREGAEMREFIGSVECRCVMAGRENCDRCIIVNSTTLGAKLVEEMERLKEQLTKEKALLSTATGTIKCIAENHVATQQKLAAARDALRPFASGTSPIPWGKIKAHLPTDFAKLLTGYNKSADAAVLKDAEDSGWVHLNGELILKMETALKLYATQGRLEQCGNALDALHKLNAARSISTQGTK